MPTYSKTSTLFDKYIFRPIQRRMKRRYDLWENAISLLLGLAIGLIIAIPVILKHYEPTGYQPKPVKVYPIETTIPEKPMPEPETHAIQKTSAQPTAITDEKPAISETDLFWFAKCVEAEASGEGLYGKRLVADVILNRVDSSLFPGKTITDIIFQHNEKTGVWQFSVAGNGMLENAEPTEETYQAIYQELECRSYPGLLYFTSEGFSPYGEPWQKIGNHYFSTAK